MKEEQERAFVRDWYRWTMIPPENAVVRLFAVGDIASLQPPEKYAFRDISTLFLKDDLVFFNCEAPYAESGVRSGAIHGAIDHDPVGLAGIADAGFNVCTLANNHIMDWGADAVVECRERLEALDITVCGAGRNRAEAHKPAIIERQGVSFGFLGYCSTGPDIIRAQDEHPGCATVRAHTAYEPADYYPGTPNINITTWPHNNDASQMRDDLQSLRDKVDVVVVTFHWGTMYVRAEIPDYELLLGHMAVDSGADLVLGHSPHILKGIEVYRGRVIAHSLNHLMVEGMQTRGSDYSKSRTGMITNPDTRKTMILKCEIRSGQVSKVTYVPAMVDSHWKNPLLAPKGTAEGQDIFDYVLEISRTAGFDTQFSWIGDEVSVSGAS